MLRRKSFAVLAGSIILTGVLSACGAAGDNAAATGGASPAAASSAAAAGSGDGQPAGSSAPAASASAAAPSAAMRTVTDEVGHTVQVPQQPQRILAPYLEDPLVALGTIPVAQWSSGNTVFEYLQPWLKDVPKTTSTPSFEEALSYKPDLILLNTSAKAENGMYESYSKIAPTYVFKSGLTENWRTLLLTVGDLIGKKEQAEAAIADYDSKAQAAKQKLAGIFQGKKAVILWIEGKDVYLVDKGRFSGEVLGKDLGIPFSDQANVETVGKPLAQLSLEVLPDLQADYIFYVREETDGADSTSPVLDNPIWKGLPAVKQGHAYEVDYGNWINGGMLANEKTIDDVLKLLAP